MTVARGNSRSIACGLAILGLVCTTRAAAADDAAWQACRAIDDDSARLACYDSLAGGTRVTPSAATAPAVAAPAPPASAAAVETATHGPSPEELFGKDAAQSDEIVRKAAGIERLDRVRLRVADLSADPFGKSIITFENGQVWAQLDNPPAKLKRGEEVEIRRAAMGSFLLIRDEGGRGLRVRRIR